jgi:pimeloyl-ACP methyl ester carboxylesterase
LPAPRLCAAEKAPIFAVMVQTYSDPPERLARDSRYRILQSALGDLVLRPWFDWVALNSVARGYFPLSRAWAAAMASGGELARFRAELQIADLPRAFAQPALILVQNRRATYEAAAAAWQSAFFGAAAPGATVLVEAERLRQETAHQLMLTRFAFLPLRRRLPAVRWEVASPEEVEAAHGARLAAPEAAFPAAPATGEVEASRPVLSAYGREYWLRYPAPVAGDTAWARVIEPERAKDPPTLIFLHGIAMENEMWRGSADLASELALQGIRVVKPEGPWHGRRRKEGWYGGEPAIGLGPKGFLDLFRYWIAEVSTLVSWARRHGDAPVALGGVSLGALNAQRAAVAANYWPARCRPDALMLVATSGAVMGVAHTGSLANAVNLAPQIEAAGWSAESLSRWLPLLEPQEAPVMAPERIVMVLGHADDVTPSAGGKALARRWQVPAANVFARHQGHFSVSLGVLRDRAPLERLKDIFADLR